MTESCSFASYLPGSRNIFGDEKMKYAYALIAAIFLSILNPFAAQASPIGEFTHVEGRVDITRADQAAIPAHTGDEVFEKDIIRAKSSSKAEIVFTDGNVLRLAQNTRVEVSEFISTTERKSTILKLFRGKIQNKVKKFMGRIFGKNEDRFEVHTPTSVCGVRGTNFFTFYQKGLSGAVFKEGRGYGYSLNRPDDVREIPTGQAMLVASPDRPPVVRPVTEAELMQHEGETAPSEAAEEENEDEATEQGDDSEGEGENKESGDQEGDNTEENADEESGAGEETAQTDEDAEDDGGIEAAEEGAAEDTENVEAGSEEGENMDQESGEYAAGDTGPDNPGDLESGDNPSTGPETGEYGPSGPENTAMIDNTLSDNPMVSDEPIYTDPVTLGDPVFDDPVITGDNPYDPTNDPPVLNDDPLYSDSFVEAPYFSDPSSDPLYIPPDVPMEEPFTISTFNLYGDVNPGPLSIYDGDLIETYHNYYILDLAGTYSWEPPFIHMSRGVEGRVLPGTGLLSGAFYRGFAGASWDEFAWEEPEKRVRGKSFLFYVASDGSGGILDGDIFGDYTDAGTWQATGYMVPTELTAGGLPFDFPEIVPRELVLGNAAGFFTVPDGGDITIEWSQGGMGSMPGQDWGMWRTEFGGTITGLTGDAWVLIGRDFSTVPADTIYRYYYASGYRGGYGEIEADVEGGWVDIASVVTGIFEGGLHGAYNPEDPGKFFFAMSGGVWIETNKFLEMTQTAAGREKLYHLYIPSIEVGRANLSGSSGLMSVSMPDVTFFSNSTGGPPRIWATNHVTGYTSATPAIDHTVNLTGNGLQVDFKVKKWDSSVWRADINGIGQYSGTGSMNNQHIEMNGGAAGTYTGSSFSGTAAGGSRVMPPP